MASILAGGWPSAATLRRVVSPWRWRSARAAPLPVLAGYNGQAGFWKRHRFACHVLFAGFCCLWGMYFVLFGARSASQCAVPVLVLAAIVVWVLPENDRASRRGIWAFLMAFLIALVCWPDYIAFAPPGAPWITAARLTSFPLLFLMLIAVSQSPTFRGEMKAILHQSPYLWKTVVGFAVLGFLSIGVSDEIGFSAGRFFRAQTTWTLIFFASAYCFVQRGRATAFCYVLWGAVLFLCALALWEWRLQHLPWFESVPTILRPDPEAFEQIVRPKIRFTTGVYRVQAVQTTPLGLAEILALSAPFVVHLAITARRAILKVAAACSLVLMYFVVTLTDGRLGTVGFLVTVTVYTLLLAVQRWQNVKSSLIAPAIIVVYPVVFSLFIVGTFFIRRLEKLVWGDGSAQSSNDARREQFEVGIPKVLSHLWGHGIGRSGDVIGLTSIDSYYLSVALEYGVMGLFLFYGMLLVAITYCARGMWRTRDADTKVLMPIMVALLNFFVIKSVLSQDANHPLVFMILGMVAALTYRRFALERDDAVPLHSPGLSMLPRSHAPARRTLLGGTSL